MAAMAAVTVHTAVHTPEGVALQMMEDFLRVKRIHADHEFCKILAVAPGSGRAASIRQAGLSRNR